MEIVVEKENKKKEPGCPHRATKVMRTPTTTYDIEEMMWSMEEDAPKGEVRNGNVVNHRLSEETLVLSILVKVVGGTECKEGHSFLETLLVVHPLLGVGVLIGEAIEVPNIQP